MMGRQTADQTRLFYEFHLEDRVPNNHLLRRINGTVAAALADLHDELAGFYSHTARPSIDPELMIRMLIIGYSCGNHLYLDASLFFRDPPQGQKLAMLASKSTGIEIEFVCLVATNPIK